MTLVPVNRLVATERPRTIPFARCLCSFCCCCGTDVVIRREGDVVRWSWGGRAPSDRDAAFAAEAYAAEVERVAADLSWETPSRTAGRLGLTRIRERRLLPSGTITTEMIGLYPRDPSTLEMTFEIRDQYQIFLRFPWDGDDDPEHSADAVCAILAGPAAQWPASRHSIKGVDTPPAIAGPSWQREVL